MKHDAFKLFLIQTDSDLLDLETEAPDVFEQLRFVFEELESEEKKQSHLRLVKDE